MLNKIPTTYGELKDRLEDARKPLALHILNDIMDDIEDDTGIRPSWNDPIPQDVLDVFYVSQDPPVVAE